MPPNERTITVSRPVWEVYEPLWNVKKTEARGMGDTSYADGIGELMELIIHLWRRFRIDYSKEEYSELKSFLETASKISIDEIGNNNLEIIINE